MNVSQNTVSESGSSSNQYIADAVKEINFPFGLPGFEHLHRFSLEEIPNTPAFYFLRAVEQPLITLVVLDLRFFKLEAPLQIPERDMRKLGIEVPDDMAKLTVIKIDKNSGRLTANIKAPILVNLKKKKGMQIILDDPALSTEYPLLQEK